MANVVLLDLLECLLETVVEEITINMYVNLYHLKFIVQSVRYMNTIQWVEKSIDCPEHMKLIKVHKILCERGSWK